MAICGVGGRGMRQESHVLSTYTQRNGFWQAEGGRRTKADGKHPQSFHAMHAFASQ